MKISLSGVGFIFPHLIGNPKPQRLLFSDFLLRQVDFANVLRACSDLIHHPSDGPPSPLEKALGSVPRTRLRVAPHGEGCRASSAKRGIDIAMILVLRPNQSNVLIDNAGLGLAGGQVDVAHEQGDLVVLV